MVEVFVFSGFTHMMREPFRKRDILIRTKNNLDAISPFAVVGKRSEKFLTQNIDKCGGRSVHSVISLKKNFRNMISRDKSRFDSNFKVYPMGENVDECNNTEYIVMSFCELYRSLYKIDGGIYSVLNEKDILNDISNGDLLPFPLEKEFNWKYYVDLLAEACIENYDREHIVLVRTSPSEWCVENNEMKLEGKSYRALRNFIRDVENYFIERTHCNCVEELLGNCSNKGWFYRNPYAFDLLAEEIDGIIKGKRKYCDFYRLLSPVARRVYLRLNDDKYKLLATLLKKFAFLTDSEFEKALFNEDKQDDVATDISKLKCFLQENAYTLTDYFRDNPNGYDLNLIELYAEYFKLDMDDFLTVMRVFFSIDDKEKMRKSIKNICTNSGCYPISSMKKNMQRNIDYLTEYKYLDDELRKALDIDLNRSMLVYPVRVSNDMYIFLCPTASKAENMVFFEKWENKIPNVEEVINNGMCCRGNQIDSISKSWRFYIKRALLGKGFVPLVCEFKDCSEFQRSIVFLNFYELLESENAIISKTQNKEAIRGNFEKYHPKCDLTGVLDKNSKIFFIGAGLGDQIRYYIYSQYIKENSNAAIYYDDLQIEYNQLFNGLDIKYFVRDDTFEDRRISNIISKNLRGSYFSKREELCDLLYEEGFEDCLAVTENWILRAGRIKKCDCLVTNCNMNTIRLASNPCFKYYYVLSSPELYIRHGDLLSKYIKFPEYKDDVNIKLENIMLSCDAVVLHIRCGDALQDSFRIPDESFFLRCIRKLSSINDYDKKRYFIISDNMNYVKSRKKEFGIDMIDEDNVYYIEHNRGENSIYDLKLISLGKIILASYSGFSRMAALLSTRKEIYLCQTPSVNEDFKRMGWKNKYDLLEA